MSNPQTTLWYVKIHGASSDYSTHFQSFEKAIEWISKNFSNDDTKAVVERRSYG